jgi:hypothetical protein
MHRPCSSLSTVVVSLWRYHYAQEGLHKDLVDDLLDPNLEDLFDMCDQ